MHNKKKQVSNRVYISIIIGSLIMTILIAGIFYRHNRGSDKTAEISTRMQTSTISPIPVSTQSPAADYHEPDKDTEIKDLLQKPKNLYSSDNGLDPIIKADDPAIDYQKSDSDKDTETKNLLQKPKNLHSSDNGLDPIIKADENLKIGGTTISMQKDMDKISLKHDGILEKTPDPAGMGAADQHTAQTEIFNSSPIPASAQPLVINYSELDKNTEIQDLLQKRKNHYGIDKELDLIIKSNEILKIGDTTISMQKIMEKIQLERGDILEKNLNSAGVDTTDQDTLQTDVFGIYIVRPGDNIWNIHYVILKNYFANRNISISPMADEPDKHGLSSGIGKLLKFSEAMVYIYNIAENRFDVDLDLIQPLNKLVIYNMGQIFALLNRINYHNVNHIQFDGETIWILANR